MRVVVLNGGSSSIKFSVFDMRADAAPALAVHGELSGVGGDNAQLSLTPSGEKRAVEARDSQAAIALVLDAVKEERFEAVGYRVVHPGAKLTDHQRITPEVLRDLEAAVEFAPLHDPEALDLIRAGMERFPEAQHFACFDTVFHRTMPVEASVYPLPKAYRDEGVRRYGFHGLSCESVVEQLRAQGPLPRRMVIAHLGSGCSVTALVDGKSVDTTMGLTPTGGVVMGTRPGDLDPGVLLYMLRGGDGVQKVEQVLNHEAGLVALSGMKNDVKAMRAAASAGDGDAVLALKVFTRSVTKAMGGYCWLLGGLDAIVFTGGIGEHDAQTRAEILAGLDGLGVHIDTDVPLAATDGIQRVSPPGSNTAVWVVPAEEDRMIAMHVERMFTARQTNLNDCVR